MFAFLLQIQYLIFFTFDGDDGEVMICCGSFIRELAMIAVVSDYLKALNMALIYKETVLYAGSEVSWLTLTDFWQYLNFLCGLLRFTPLFWEWPWDWNDDL